MLAVICSLRSLTVIAAVVLASGCQAWKVDNRPAPTVIERAGNDKVAITMDDRRWVVLNNAQVQSDSIVGMRVTGNTVGTGRTALSLPRVRAIETRRFSITRTLGLGVVALFIPSLYRFAIIEEE